MFHFGIIPAAGKGTRLRPLPFSKELFPIGYQQYEDRIAPAPVSQHLILAMKAAGIRKLYLIIHPDKTDILKYYTDGAAYGMEICYLLQNEQKGMVQALSQVTPWLPAGEDGLISFGMPDTLFRPHRLFAALHDEMRTNSSIDVLLGIFPTNSWHKLGMTFYGDQEAGSMEVLDIQDKPAEKPATDYAWGVAVWKKTFQLFLTEQAKRHTGSHELVLGNVFLSAKAQGMNVRCMKGDAYLDIGTIEDLQNVIREMNQIIKIKE
ncbi:hypothetical protein E5161_02435 [Cohnella pontilimi]|uniref:Glucose-1-phosphate thymidylyltransferase n=1 Tax=Cohnella pontilimi TaxID=2564100 RepID=A0A4U0FH37_9BACL|nr:sugar phosphate nucleotidyltransferase [Cohnella pontilimi]TJY44265.1 hypothetical protein E5161_02435 [Cohnella pontilimi]